MNAVHARSLIVSAFKWVLDVMRRQDRNKIKGGTDETHAQDEQKHTKKESDYRRVHIEPGSKIDFVEDFRKQYETANQQTSTYNGKQLF